MEKKIEDDLKEIEELNQELGNSKYVYEGPQVCQKKETIVAAKLKNLRNQKEKRMVELYDLKVNPIIDLVKKNFIEYLRLFLCVRGLILHV